VSKIDLDTPSAGHKYTVTIDKEESHAEQYVRLFKDVVLFLVGVGFVVVIASLCIHTLENPSTTAEEKKWAMSILSLAAGGIIGYLVKK
jgi:hypothetical protein